MLDIATALFMLIGALFMAMGALGVIRFPDLYSRLSAVSKAATLGLSTLALAVVLDAHGDPSVLFRAMAVIAIAAITTPLSAHLLARAAYAQGVPLWKGTIREELHGRHV